MQLDKTRIVIRERSFADILDLSLRVIRDYALPLTITSLIGAVPMILLNNWYLSDLLDDLEYSTWTSEDSWYYLYLNVFLIIWELPLAAAPTTLYLGQALFVEKPSAARVLKDLAASLPQLFFYQVLLRGVLTALHITWPVLFLVWPYLNEILLLERNPWRKKGGLGTSTLGRAATMHSGNFSELFGRWICSVLIAAALIAALWGSMFYLRGWLTYQIVVDRALFEIYLQVAIWVVISYFTVVRYLSYLDLRIRTEGWEIELAMRAQAQRLTRTIA